MKIPTEVAMRTKHFPKEDNSTMATSCQVSYKSAKCCPPDQVGDDKGTSE